MTTPNVGLSEMPSNSLQPSVPFNLSMQIIDALMQLSPEDKDLSADPTTTGGDVGKTWIIASSGSGDWTGKAAGTIALCTAANVWLYLTPKEGWRAYVRDEDKNYIYDGSAWALAINADEVGYDNATSGLTATDIQAAIDEVAALAGASGIVMTHVTTYTVTGAAATTMAVSGLDLGADECYEIHGKIDNATGSSANISLFYNSDTTATNYDRQGQSNNNAAITASRANDAAVASMDANEPLNLHIRISKDADGRARATVTTNYGAAASIKSQRFDHVWTSTSNPTGFTLSSSVASAFAIGSELKVYRIKEP